MAFCFPPKEAINLVLNASKATISSKSDVAVGTASHLYTVRSEWNKQYGFGRMLSRCMDETNERTVSPNRCAAQRIGQTT